MEGSNSKKRNDENEYSARDKRRAKRAQDTAMENAGENEVTYPLFGCLRLVVCRNIWYSHDNAYACMHTKINKKIQTYVKIFKVHIYTHTYICIYIHTNV